MAKRSPRTPSAPPATETAQLQEVRDLLFGAQVTELIDQMRAMSEQIEGAQERDRREFADRIEQLEKSVRNELQALSERIREESAERKEADSSLRNGIDRASSESRKRLAGAESKIAEQIEELRRQSETARTQLQSRLESGEDALQQRLVHRADLAEALSRLASSLEESQRA